MANHTIKSSSTKQKYSFLRIALWMNQTIYLQTLYFQVSSLQKNLDDAKAVNKEIAATLEAVMSSHSQLQSVVEGLQVDLGKKDSQMAHLKSEK